MNILSSILFLAIGFTSPSNYVYRIPKWGGLVHGKVLAPSAVRHTIYYEDFLYGYEMARERNFIWHPEEQNPQIGSVLGFEVNPSRFQNHIRSIANEALGVTEMNDSSSSPWQWKTAIVVPYVPNGPEPVIVKQGTSAPSFDELLQAIAGTNYNSNIDTELRHISTNRTPFAIKGADLAYVMSKMAELDNKCWVRRFGTFALDFGENGTFTVRDQYSYSDSGNYWDDPTSGNTSNSTNIPSRESSFSASYSVSRSISKYGYLTPDDTLDVERTEGATFHSGCQNGSPSVYLWNDELLKTNALGTGRVYSTFAWAFFAASYRHQRTIRSGAAFLEDGEWVEIVHQTSRPIDTTINAQVAIPIPITLIGKSDPYSESIGWVGSKWSTEKTAVDVFEAISRLISGNGLSPSSPSYPQLDDPQDPQENEFAEVSETESFSIGSNAGCNMLLFFKVNPSSGYSFGAGL